MGNALALSTMTTEDKLRALEEIWADLSGRPEDIPFPSWHADVLEAREKRIQAGSEGFTDWDEAKKAIREETR
ncbi:MAG: addiction module protein [Candidatus Sumerlaeaceae bacterium]|nr:addiction module protein [Candidatus Sumerlaeaceae bacterium]